MSRIASSAESVARRLAAHPKAWVAIFLAWAAGFIDVIGWLAVFHAYVSHMTGNTATLARDLVDGHGMEALRHGWPIIPFIAGLLYSAATTKAARLRGFHASFSVALFTELVLLAAALVTRTPGYVLLSLLSAAMGTQTVTVTRIQNLRVYTTYLTGTLAKFSESVVDFAFWFYGRTGGRFRKQIGAALHESLQQRSLQHTALLAGLWIGFFAGAVCGAAAHAAFGLFALLAPMAVVLGAAIIDLRWPVAAADEPSEDSSAH